MNILLKVWLTIFLFGAWLLTMNMVTDLLNEPNTWLLVAGLILLTGSLAIGVAAMVMMWKNELKKGKEVITKCLKNFVQ